MEIVIDKLKISVIHQFILSGQVVEIPMDLEYLGDRIVTRFEPVQMSNDDTILSELVFSIDE